MDTEILLGIDYGESKTGISLGRNGLVMPLMVLKSKDEMAAVHEITRIILENKISTIVMGLPVTADGKDTPQARKVRRFSKLLKLIRKKPVIFSNEYGTTKDTLEESRNKQLLAKGTNEDALAAALILKRYYNEK